MCITKQSKTGDKQTKEMFTEREFEDMLSRSKLLAGTEKRTIENESLCFIKDGRSQCQACVKPLNNICHCGNPVHKKQLIEWKEKKEKQSRLQCSPHDVPDIEETSTNFRIEALRAIASANIPLTALEDMRSFIEYFSKPGYRLGHVRDIPRNYAGILHRTLKMEIKHVLNRSFNQFGLIFDGTPSFAEAEAIKIRVVTKKYEIMELLVKVACFQKKLNSNNIVNHIISTIQSDLLLHVENWRTSQQDRASTNTAALRKIKETILGANPTKNDCVSHKFSNAGKAMIQDDHAPYANLFRKIWQAIIQYPGQARDLACRIFIEPVKESGGVRFFKKYEQIQQITQIVREC